MAFIAKDFTCKKERMRERERERESLLQRISNVMVAWVGGKLERGFTMVLPKVLLSHPRSNIGDKRK